MSDNKIQTALARAAAGLRQSEKRPQQLAMAEAVARAVNNRRHLVVQAGTGTGKSLAYLVPGLVLGARMVVSTATKALQDQLAQRDLPRLARSLGVRFEFAVLKGRSNYLCVQRVREIAETGEQLAMDQVTSRPGQHGRLAAEIERLVAWAGVATAATSPATTSPAATSLGGTSPAVISPAGASRVAPPEPGAPVARHRRPHRGLAAARRPTGDRGDLDWEPSDAAWAQVSTTSRECPGAADCASGADCFAEAARRRAAEVDVVVVNTHLYASFLAVDEAELLPEHDVVVFDEAHEVEDIASAVFGFDLGGARVGGVARLARAALGEARTVTALQECGALLDNAALPLRDQEIPRPLPAELARVLNLLRERAAAVLEVLRQAERAASALSVPGTAVQAGPPERRGSRQRAQTALSHLVDDVIALLELAPGQVAWVEGGEHALLVRASPLDVGAVLKQRLWEADDAPVAILTSATIPPHLGERLGLEAGSYDQLDVGSPFAYPEQAMLYCPVHLPDPRAAGFEAAMHQELTALVQAAGGRTLALFTSWRAMHAAAEHVRGQVPWRILTQSDLPKAKLVAEFSADEQSCLFATMGFWQGVDVPGSSLSLVTIDRLPFARPDDPLLRA
ncbi:MAG TPA: ATP-dependent DNA helicase, partial [Acidimicrobiales bacterium]|nr:ATP-dependent DNA helicase [Acidimicrobiales bacterium]